MFTGIVETIGAVQEIAPAGKAVRLRVSAPGILEDTAIGDSIAVNGVCLTVTELRGCSARFDVVPETVQRTTLRELRPGSPVNLERALLPTSRLGGHFVQGHVDGVGTVQSLHRSGEEVLLTVQAPPEVTQFLVEKGSIAIDGVSLTVAGLTPDGFTVALIPHTLSVTTLGRRGPGDPVNLEADIIGKYVARYLTRYAGAGAAPDGDDRLLRLLQEEGFTG